MCSKTTVFLIILILFPGSSVFPQAEKRSSSEHDQRLIAYLKSHRRSPKNYVISKFSNHDIVFIGEYHRIKHDVEPIHKLIPLLYKALEFGCYEHQDKVDRLITAETDFKQRFRDLK